MTTTKTRLGLGHGLGSYANPKELTDEKERTMQRTNSHLEIVEVVERRLAALEKDGLNRREAFVEIERTTPEIARRFRKLATLQQLRDLEAGHSELIDLRQKLTASEKRIAELEAELAALRGVPAAM